MLWSFHIFTVKVLTPFRNFYYNNSQTEDQYGQKDLMNYFSIYNELS